MAKSQEVRKLMISDTGVQTYETYHNVIVNSPIKHYINQCLFESIDFANKNKKKYAKLIEICGEGRVIKVDRANWKIALANILPIYEKEEMWEQCIKIRDLINNIA